MTRTPVLIGSVLLALGLGFPVLTRALVDAPPPPEVAEGIPDDVGGSGKPSVPVDGSRGQLLYENHCTSCHESVVHVRENHEVRSPAALREEVAKWAESAHLGWGGEEIDDVAGYLDARFYRFESR